MKNRYKISVTYDLITPKSAAHGDAEESGFECEPARGNLRDAISALEEHAYHCENFDPRGLSQSLYATDGIPDYSDGSETRYAVHFDIADRRWSKRRIARSMHWLNYALSKLTEAGKLGIYEARKRAA